MNPSPSPLHQNTIAGRYSIRKKLGSGSLGTVYLAEDRPQGRLVALKVLRTDRVSSEAVERLRQEFGAITSLHHPQIAAAYDFGYTDGGALPYYTREYVEGKPLAAGPPGRTPPRDFLKPILDLLDALQYLHAHGILHLDIHPGNLIVSSDAARGSVLIDFGLFRSLEGPQLTATTQPLFPLPPEIFHRDRLSPSTDIYLAGRLLLYLLCGEAAVEARLPREIAGWGSRMTLELERIAAKAVDAEPRRRFSTAAELREALTRSLGGGTRERGPLEPAAALVGRESELQRVEEALKAAVQGRGAALVLTGPPGVGKTRLLAQARVSAQFLGLETLEVRFFPDPGPASPLLSAIGGSRHGKPGWIEPLEAEHGGTPEERARRAAKAYFEEEGRAMAFFLDDLDRADRRSRILAEALLLEAAGGRQERRASGPGGSGRGLCVVASLAGPGLPGIARRDILPLHPLRPADSRRLLQALAQPVSIPDRLASKAAARAKGSPLRLRQIARALIAEWGKRGSVPPGAELPVLASDPISAILAAFAGVPDAERAILRALAILGHPASCAEIAYALQLGRAVVRSRLSRLERAELIVALQSGGCRLFQLSRPDAGARLREELPPEAAQRLHRRMARFLEERPRLLLREREMLSRHLLLSGRRERGLRQALLAAQGLRKGGYQERAVALLEEALAQEDDPRRRFSILEELSSILEEIGDHAKGVTLLEPFHREAVALLAPRPAIQLRRRLGVHYHRAGRADAAVKVFQEAGRLADPRRDVEDLVFIDSELAELYTLRGLLDEAGAACRRGLKRLLSLRRGDAFRARMEVILRASRGHLELRRFDLSRARRDFQAALRLSRRFRMPAVRAVILNNLGIAENQLNRFAEARRAFREAEQLYLAAGEKRSVILIACNLAVIAAKLGELEEARLEIERAEQLLRNAPAERLEFSTAYSRGIVACLLGEAESALESLPPALSLGRRLGDSHLVRYGEVFLSEALMACGRYGEAWRKLWDLSREAKGPGPPILVRMVHSRLFLLAGLLGHGRAAERARSTLEATPRTGMLLLEAWNDLFAGLACLVSGVEMDRLRLQGAGELFQRFRVVAGERLARQAFLLEALARGPAGDEERRALGRQVRLIEAEPPETHRFLAVTRPLLLAEAQAFLGNLEQARERLTEASGAIIGSPFLELDWRIEFLRARLALKAGDAQGARAHLHRALHTRDLLQELLPRKARARFLAHPRFQGLETLVERLERSPRIFSSTGRPGAGAAFEGMVGSSRPMVQVFETIDRLRGQEIPILITGATGTGKELVARALHRTSARARGPFFALHAGSLPVELFETELFGHERGAFTGAEEAKPGLLEDLAGGTLLLDEVSELPQAAQAKILRLLDSGRARRLGSSEERTLDVRLLASTSADLRERVRAGAFREDLLYRLGGMEIRLPPLRERREDIALLAQHFLELHARRLDRPRPHPGPGVIELLQSYPWPGNVRELETLMLRALALLSPHQPLGVKEIEPLLASAAGSGNLEDERFFRELLSEEPSLDELKVRIERFYLLHLWKKVGGDPRKMMRVLGVKQSYYYSRLKEVGIDVRALRERLGPHPGKA